LGADVDWGALRVTLSDSARVSGGFGIRVGIGGLLRVAQTTTITGSVRIAGRMEVASGMTLNLSGLLTLEATGVLDNQGTLRCGDFDPIAGSTVIGNAPQIVVPGPVIQSIRLEPVSLQPASLAGPTEQVVLTWTGPAAEPVVVESSSDLRHWIPEPGTIVPLGKGRFEMRCGTRGRWSYYRIRGVGAKP
jgi:hypothetical protein